MCESARLLAALTATARTASALGDGKALVRIDHPSPVTHPDVRDFLQGKFTSVQLYDYMVNQISATYFQDPNPS
jgi:hypothetical protein